LVTALETNETVPKMETVTEHLLHKEQKVKEKREKESGHTKALASQTQLSQKLFKRHFKRNYCKLTFDKEKKGRPDNKIKVKHQSKQSNFGARK